MITDTIKPLSPPAAKRCNLLLHCGSHAVSRSELAQAQTPSPNSTWQPIPHIRLLQVVEHALLDHGFTITGQAHGLTHNCARYFGLIEVSGFAHHSDYNYVVGVRNSHDMRFSAGLSMQVNLAGLPLSLKLVCGNEHDSKSALDTLRGFVGDNFVLADRVYDTNAIRKFIEDSEAFSVIHNITRDRVTLFRDFHNGEAA